MSQLVETRELCSPVLAARGWGMSRVVSEISMSFRRTDGEIDEDLEWSATGVDVFAPSMPWRTFR
ncbi:hypothetical protein OG266_38480 [Streptomyces sp. NBC_00554]|uniref:hypothetical protein n=1 Tax=Streptomyces sp. NBC_00554 TaxID=2903661 RepID=UPI00352E4999|nr:hypothetical protein OG266_38480 [Streptomyces sp. NBC_00554]